MFLNDIRSDLDNRDLKIWPGGENSLITASVQNAIGFSDKKNYRPVSENLISTFGVK